MSAEALFLIHTVLVWSGLALVCVHVWRHIGKGQQSGSIIYFLLGVGLILVAQGIPHKTGHPLPFREPWTPVVWPIMPFPGWFLAVSLVMAVVSGSGMFRETEAVGRKKALQSLLAWIVAAGLCLVWWAAMDEPIKLLRGALPLAIVPLGILYLILGALAYRHFMGTKSKHSTNLAQRRSFLRTSTIYAALTFGSALFCLPLIWLLLTSFKERDDNTAANLVWVPKVTRQHSYFDEEKPLYSTFWEGKRVLVSQVGTNPDGTWALDVERPFPLKGWRVTARPRDLKQEPKKGAVVETHYQSRPVTAFVRRDLVGGEREVEILQPIDLKSRRFKAQASETKPVREVGIRWENYSEALEWLPPETQGGLVYLRNTLWLVVMSTIGTLLSCSLVAYGFSRVRFPGRSALFGLLLATMMLPGAVTMLPRFLIWRGLGAIDTLVPIWLPTFTASAFFVFLLREFFKTLPLELEDAAKIDGCSPLRTYWQVMMPQIKPALTVIGIWTFMGAWNDFMSPLIYVSSSEKMPITYAIQLFSVDKGGEFGLMMAFATMATLPVLIVFLIGQRYFVEGVQLSGLGGK